MLAFRRCLKYFFYNLLLRLIFKLASNIYIDIEYSCVHLAI